jgi:putative flavoprotein involved in K+ transport
VPEEEPVALDLAAEGIAAVVWATGFRPDYRWVEVGVFDGTGHPTHRVGETDVPGLFFLGLPWLSTWGSGRFAGVARDAAHVAERIAARAGAPVPA